MSLALEALRAKNRTDVKLPSGLLVTIRLPRIRDCIIAGDVPLPVLAKMDVATEDAVADLSADEMRALAAFNDELVKMAVVAIEGEDVALSLEDVGEFEDDDYNEIAAYASRQKPLPGKD